MCHYLASSQYNKEYFTPCHLAEGERGGEIMSGEILDRDVFGENALDENVFGRIILDWFISIDFLGWGCI